MTTESMGYMLQGVSQQQPKVRLPGQVTEQINWLADINKGLTSRPHTDLVGTLSSPVEDATRSVTVKINQELFRVVMRNGQLPRVIDYTGTERVVTGTNAAYCSTDSACYVYDSVVYMTNRNRIVTKDNSFDPSSEYIPRYTWAYVLGGTFSRRFVVTLRFGSTTVSGSYSTPDGTGAGHAALAASDKIMEELFTSLQTELAPHPGFTMERFENYMFITRDPAYPPITSINTRDGESGVFLKGGVGEADDVADLPKYAINGALLKLTGDSSTSDDFWMRFQTNGEATAIGDGFGEEGVWREFYDPAAAFKFNANTMPHILEKQPDGSFVFGPETWEVRRVGNAESNIAPSFVGSSIRDIREMQGRLTFITSASTVVMSRVDFPQDFWKKSAVANTVTDPVDIRATDEGTLPLEYMVGFDKDLFVFAENAQFLISGSGMLTPDNASTALSTKYDMSVKTRPIATGRTVLLPFSGARYSGINEYFTSDDYATQAVDIITKTANKYIDGEITDIAVASNDGLAFFLTTESDKAPGKVYVYKYLWEDTKKSQSSWSTWTYDGSVRHVYCDGGSLYVWLRIAPPRATVAHEVLLRVRLDTPSNDDLGYPVCLDAQEYTEVNVTDPNQEFVTITSPRRNLSFILVSADPDSPAGDSILPDEVVEVDGVVQYRFARVERPWLDQCTIISGVRIPRYVKLTRPFARRADGTPRSDVQVVIHALYVDFDTSGSFEVVMESTIRGNITMGSTDWFPMDDDPLAAWKTNVKSGTLQVIWGEYAQYADIAIKSDDARPTTLMEVRYEPEYLKDGG